MNERPIPEAALMDEDSVEMIRVWIANKKLHTSLKIGMYRESTNVPEEKAWGRILADTARHVADALSEGFGVDAEACLLQIRDHFIAQLNDPQTTAKGGFVKRH
ncbi:MAG: DUF5076 domain-containing protein [Arenimonas sp.]